MPHSIRTERLLLRPVILRDAAAFWRTHNFPDYTRMTGSWRYPFSYAETCRRIRETLEADDERRWFTVLKDGQLAGAALLFAPEDDSIEIGYSVSGQFAGQGIAGEASHVLCAHAFDLLGYKVLRARVSTENAVSIHILERLGFARMGGQDMGWSAHYGKDTPLYHYRLTRERFRP